MAPLKIYSPENTYTLLSGAVVEALGSPSHHRQANVYVVVPENGGYRRVGRVDRRDGFVPEES